ncbi:MAG: polysaccharide deacetylase family protein [Propionibacteriaceae bacterium]|nr:polysaccharide deacetylase family protein [Propionibacteriaceae bacterium]
MATKDKLLHAGKVAAMRILEKAPQNIGSVSSVRLEGARPVVFTYDDGPTPGRTPDVMDALAEHGATATFFVLMTSVHAHPELLREVIAAGHEVGLHGVDHRHLPSLPIRVVADNVRRGKAELEDIVGQPIRWFRPPYGHQSPADWHTIRAAGMESVLWSSTSWDWNRKVDNAKRVEIASLSLHPGAVILLHDGHASDADLAYDGPEPQLDRRDLTDRLLRVCAERDLTCLSLGNLVDRGGELVRRPHFTIRPRLHRR